MASKRISDETGRAASGRILLGALFLLFLAAMVQPVAYAQGRGAAGAPTPPGQNAKGMRVFIWAGPKTHGPGQHDYPRFLAEWAELLTAHGAIVDGSLHPPYSADLERTDVVVIYIGDAGYLSETQKATLDAYVKRGGGLVSLHDALCGPDPVYLASILGGAKKHGEVNFTLDAPVQYAVADKSDPIMKDMTELTIWDEAFYGLTWAKNPGIKVLATNAIYPTRSAGDHKGEIVPQIWSYEHTVPGGQPSRAFVWMQGHTYDNFNNWQIQRTLFRGIAWAAKRPVDELVDYVPPVRPARMGAPGTGMGGPPPAGRGMPPAPAK